jgi:ABC-type phosphate/phosphonate transport system substrate-binding protein
MRRPLRSRFRLGNRIFCAGALVAAASLPGLAALGAGEPRRGTGQVRIGLVSSLFRDVKPALVQMSLQPFSALVRSQTGLDGRPVVIPDALALGQQLHEDKVQFAVFHGVEFAWAQHKYPDLRPLVIAVNRHRQLRANLVVRHDSPVKAFADLKGKKVALPRGSREHCHLFLERAARTCAGAAREFFGATVVPDDVEAALDDVIRRKVDAAVVDGVALECYQLLKPGCFAGLKVARPSEVFPAAVVAYRPGALDEATLARFRDGLLKAHQNSRTRELMFLWRLTAFEAIPDDYQQNLTEIRKVYPGPEGR